MRRLFAGSAGRATSHGGETAESEPHAQRGALGRGWRLLPRAFHYLRPYRALSLLTIVLTVLLAVVALAEPWPLAFIVDTVLSNRRPPEWIAAIVGEGRGTLILFAVVGSLLLTVISGGLTVLNEYATTKVDQRMVLDFRSDLFQHVQRLSLAFHDDERTGMLMYRINNQADAVGQILVALPSLAQSLLTLIGMLWIAYRIDPILSLVAVAIVPFVYFSVHYYADRIEPQLLKVRGMEGQNLSIVHEAMSMLRVIVSFGREKHEFDRFRRQGEETVNARINLTVRQTAFQLAVSLITAVGTAAVLGVGALRVMNADITAGELLVVMAYIARVYAPLETLTNSMTSFQENFISFDHALKLLDTPLDVKEKDDAQSIERSAGSIEFDDVSFSYRDRPNTLRNISFSIEPGEAVAIVGPTGAGKSTLVSLIPRLYDPQQGHVLIDGIDVRDLTLQSLRAQFSIVLQEPLLFSGSIAENIGYGKPGSTQAEIEEAARAANAHDFIVRLPQQYLTQLGERGARISGGERQRISVARAFLRDAPVLILDEPTSSIDSRTEGVILEALERLMDGRTTIMIAHRLSTIRSADRILVLNEGELVQHGTHKSLVSQEGLYRQLWQAQIRARQRMRAAREAMVTVGPPPTVSIAPITADISGGMDPLATPTVPFGEPRAPGGQASLGHFPVTSGDIDEEALACALEGGAETTTPTSGHDAGNGNASAETVEQRAWRQE